MKTKIIIVVFVIVHCTFIIEDCMCQWLWQYPLPQGNKLNSVKFINNSTGWAVGDKGTVIKTTDGGYNWTVLYNNIDFPIADFHFVDSFIGYACFNSNTIIKTTNGGQNWNIIFSENYPRFTKIYFLNYNTGYVSGLSNDAQRSMILNTTNAGNNWTIYFLGTQNGYGIDDFQIFNQNINFVARDGIYLSKTTNSGLNWQSYSVGWAITKIFFADSLNGISCGGYTSGSTPMGIVKKITNGGSNFYNVFSCTDTVFKSMYFPNLQTGYIAGYKGGIRKTTNLGTTWSILNSGTNINLYTIFFKDVNTGIVAGDYGCILKTNNAGNNWSKISKGTLNNFITSRFFNENTGYVGGERVILKTTNGGANWITVLDTANLSYLKSINFINSNTGFVLGGPAIQDVSHPSYLIKTVNGGQNWTCTLIFGWSSYRGVYDLCMLNENTGFACGTRAYVFPPGWYEYNGLFLKTTNGGQNWSQLEFSSGRSTKIHFFNENNGIIFNIGNKAYKTTNSGNNWIENTFCESDKQFVNCFFKDQNTGWAIYIISGKSMLYKTTNAGNNWQLKDSINNASIKSVFFDSNNNGWAVGSAVYANSNGGNNWVLQRTPCNTQLNDVYFYNSNTGWIMGNAGSILKTTSGIQSGINNITVHTPVDYYLYQNYPNPFNPSTIIKYRLLKNSYITLKIFDITGKEIITLADERKPAGNYEIMFNGKELPSGIYFCRLKAGDFIDTKKLVLIK